QAQTDKVSNIIQTCAILFILLFGISDLTFAFNVDQQMQQAGEYYRNGEFDNAIKIYEELTSDGYEGISLYFNLANSYYRIGQLGQAILNYERALRLSPSDEDVKHNLAFANLSTVDRIQPLPTFLLFEWWESILASLTINGWTYLSYFFFILLVILIVIYFFAKTIFQQKLILFSGLGILALFLIVISLLIVKINREENVIEGVIIEQSLTVKTSPDLKSTDAFVIHEGLKVNLDDKLDNWVKIRLADGKVGWIENDTVERI
ncbi:MAG: tetratricopeptide repeat protein, partial [Ignavibacteria bacterium]|nr:tetratricopeptide repeat protein [Ignavibacteria bacterium]